MYCCTRTNTILASAQLEEEGSGFACHIAPLRPENTLCFQENKACVLPSKQSFNATVLFSHIFLKSFYVHPLSAVLFPGNVKLVCFFFFSPHCSEILGSIFSFKNCFLLLQIQIAIIHYGFLWQQSSTTAPSNIFHPQERIKHT